MRYLGFMANPTLGNPFVKATLEGLQRSLAKPVIKKEPITVETSVETSEKQLSKLPKN